MTDAATERPTYGNWIRSRSPGLFGAGMLGTLVLFASILAALLALLAGGPVPAGVVAGTGLVTFTALGTPAGSWLARRALFGYAASKGETIWRSGVLTRNTNPSNRLPGVLGKVELLTASDPFSEFVVLKAPGGLYTMVVRCSAEGPWMQDQHRVDSCRPPGEAAARSSSASRTAIVNAATSGPTDPTPSLLSG